MMEALYAMAGAGVGFVSGVICTVCLIQWWFKFVRQDEEIGRSSEGTINETD